MIHGSGKDLTRRVVRVAKTRIKYALSSLKLRCHFWLKVKFSGGFARNEVWARSTSPELGFRFSVASLGELHRVLGAHRKEPMTQRWIKEMPEGSRLWDVGANIGVFSFLAARGGVKVVAIETLPSNVLALNQTLVANATIASNVTVIPLALSQTDGLKPLLSSNWAAASSGAQVSEVPFIKREPPDQSLSKTVPITVLTLTGDTLLKFLGGAEAAPNFIKLDVDGNELEILRGFHDILSNGTVMSLLVETQDLDQRRDIEAFLIGLGYSMQSDDVEPSVLADPERGCWNLIFRRVPETG